MGGSMNAGAFATLLPSGLARRLARAFVGLVTAALVVNGAISMWLSYEEATASAVGVQREKALAAAERVAQFVGEIEGQIGWTTRAEWARVQPEQRRYDFIRLLRQAPAVTEALHIDGQGREQLRLSRLEPDVIGSGVDHSADPRFVRAVADRVWYGPVNFRRGSEPYMTLSIAHAGRNPGVTSVGVNLKLVWDVITGIRVGEQGYAYVTDAAGKLIAHPDMSLVLRDTDLSHLPQVAGAIRSALAEGGAAPATVKAPDGRDVLSASARIPKLGWLVFVELPRREVLAPVLTSLTQTLALLGLGSALALLLGGWLARRMAAPIQELSTSAARLGAGDLAHRVEPRPGAGEEIVALADSFNAMGARLQESYAGLEAKVEERTAELGEALRYQTGSANILRVISQSPTDVAPVFDAIVESAVRLLRTDLAFVMRTDGKTVAPVAGAAPSGRIADMVPPRPVDPDEHFPSRAIVAKATLQFPDWSQIDLPPHERKVHERFGIRSSMYLPLLRGDECLGVLTFACKQPRVFDAKEVALAESFRDQAMIAIENTRLFNETNEALVHQTGTGKILQVIASSPTDIKPVLQAVAMSACEVCDAYDGAVVLRQGDDLAFSAHHGPIPIGLDRWPLNRNWTAGRAVLDRTTVHVHDLQGPEGEAYPDGRDFSIRMGHRTIASVPLLREGESIGAIVLRRKEVHPFTEKQLALLRTFADQAVIAINNVRLFEEVQAKTGELQESLEYQTATSDVLSVISRSPTRLQPVLDTIIETALRLCQARYGLVLRLGGDGLYHYAASAQVDPSFVDFVRRNPVAAGDGSAVGIAAAEKRTLHMPDALADPRFTDRRRQQQSKARTMLSVPLMRDGAVLGVIFLAHTEVKPFTDRQIDLVTTFADQAVIAMENARLFEEVQAKTRALETSLDDLKAAQSRLIQSEKLASLGQLTAGIAHEIKNPLNFVNNFADLSVELVGELEDALATAGDALDPAVKAEVGDVSTMLKSNLGKIVQHGRRADSIVKNMLAHSRAGGGEARLIDLNATVDEALNLAYHGARAEKPGFNITLERAFDPGAGQIELYPQEFTRVLLNLIGNGFHAANKKRQDGAPNGFEPVLRVATRGYPDRIEIKVRDNGTGIPDAVKARIFEPFFTTKPTGEGTGLGLSLSHDIVVKQHGGKLDIETEPGAYTEFTVTLPRRPAAAEAQ
jgi:two-component system, NtrC family, sensor kinase